MPADLSKLSPAALKAAMTSGTDGWGRWGGLATHARYMEPYESRRRCRCGCRKRVTHAGRANGVTLATGCAMSMARWVRDGR